MLPKVDLTAKKATKKVTKLFNEPSNILQPEAMYHCTSSSRDGKITYFKNLLFHRTVVKRCPTTNICQILHNQLCCLGLPSTTFSANQYRLAFTFTHHRSKARERPINSKSYNDLTETEKGHATSHTCMMRQQQQKHVGSILQTEHPCIVPSYVRCINEEAS